MAHSGHLRVTNERQERDFEVVIGLWVPEGGPCQSLALKPSVSGPAIKPGPREVGRWVSKWRLNDE